MHLRRGDVHCSHVVQVVADGEKNEDGLADSSEPEQSLENNQRRFLRSKGREAFEPSSDDGDA